MSDLSLRDDDGRVLLDGKVLPYDERWQFAEGLWKSLEPGAGSPPRMIEAAGRSEWPVTLHSLAHCRQAFAADRHAGELG